MNGLLDLVEDMIQEHPEIRVVSFDIFDTIIFRMVSQPADVFEMVGRSALETEALPEWVCPTLYRELRITAEQKARELCLKGSGSSEVVLDDIMARISYACGQKEKLYDLEIQAEQEVCYLNPDLERFSDFVVGHPDIQFILISDMYLPEKDIKMLLGKIGFPLGLLRKIYVSGEYKNSKNNGVLYDIVLKDLGIVSGQLLHIGDNYMQDVVNAKKYGIHTLYYDAIPVGEKEFFYEKIKYGNILPKLASFRKYTLAKYYDDNHDDWHRIGMKYFGPVMTAFAEWILDSADRMGVTEIYPLMREGWFISKLLKNAAGYRKKEYHIKPLYISRKAVLLPSLKKWDEEAYEKMLAIPEGTVETILKNFCMEGSVLDAYKDIKLTELGHKTIQDENAKEFVRQYLYERKDYIDGMILDETARFMKYLKNFRIDQPFFTVDFGMNGTMQEAIDTICDGNNGISHFLFASTPKIFSKLLRGIDIRSFLSGMGGSSRIAEDIYYNVVIFETVMSAPTGTTQGYTEDGKPVLAEFLNKNVYQYAEKCQQGILDFQKEYLMLVKKMKKCGYESGIQSSMKDVDGLMKSMMCLIDMPTLKEVQMFADLEHDENYGVDKVDTICPAIVHEHWQIRNVEDFVRSCQPGQVPWYAGMVTLLSPSYLFEKEIFYSSTQYDRMVIGIVSRLVAAHTDRVVVCGAGEAARKLLNYLKIFDIGIEAFTDNNETLQGEEIEGIPIKSLKDEFQSSAYVVASFAYAVEIEREIRMLKGEEVTIYHF